MRRLLPWGLAAAALAACQFPQPAAPPSPPATQPTVQPVPGAQAPRTVLSEILFLMGPDTLEAGQTATLLGRAMLPAGSEVLSLDVQASAPSPSPTPRSPFGATTGVTSAFLYTLRAEADVPDPRAPKAPKDFELPFTPPTAGLYHLDLGERRQTILVGAGRRTSSWPGTGTSPDPLPELWGLLRPAALPDDQPVLGHPELVPRAITSVQMPTSARAGQRVQMVARFWTGGLGKTAVDAYVQDRQIRVTGLSLPDKRAVMGPIPQQVEVPFSVFLAERGLYSVISDRGEGGFGQLNVY